MGAINREERQKCWAVRDELFKCLDGVEIEQEDDSSTCAPLRQLLQTSCPASWANHFIDKHRNDRKREAELRKMGAVDIHDAIKNGDPIKNACLILVRGMRKGRMPSKHGNKQYYKGTGSGSMGEHHRGTFILNPKKIRQWMIPDLTDFPLKPYVSHTVNKTKCSKEAIKTVQDYIDRARQAESYERQ